MADVKLTGAANWSAFKAGVVNGDTVYMNGFILTIDEAITAYGLCIFTNAAGGTVGAVSGGNVSLGGNFDVTLAGITNGSTTVTFLITANRTATLNLGTVQAGSGHAFSFATVGGSNITFVNTTFIGGSSANCYALYQGVAVTLNFTNCTAVGGTGANGTGVYIGVAGVVVSGTLHLTQAATTGGTSPAFYAAANGSGTLSGSVVHRGSGNTYRADAGVFTYTMTSETITGAITGNGNQGLWMSSGTAIVTVNRPAGSITHSVATHYLLKFAAGATLTCVGDITCGSASGNYVAYDQSTGIGSITIDGTVTGPASNTGVASGLLANSGGKIYVKHISVGAAGTIPSLTNVSFMSTSQLLVPTSGSNITLVNSASAADYPSAANVRSGTSYAYGALSGTCAVPGAASVASGVAVDNTTGTAVLTAATAKAQVVAALITDTYAELAAVPAATASLKDKITWVFQWLRNKSTQTSSQRKLYADDGSTVVSTEAVSDDGTTYTKGEAS